MQQTTKTKNQPNTITLIICIIITALAVAYAIGQREHANMVQYAAANNCTWHATGTMYGDDRDYVCSKN